MMKKNLSTKHAAKYTLLSLSLTALVLVLFIPFNKKDNVSLPVKISSAVATTKNIFPVSLSQNPVVLTKEEKAKKKIEIAKKIEKLQIAFRKNMGQWDEQILYKGRNSGINLSFMKNGLSYGVGRGEGKNYEQLVWNEYFEGMNENVAIGEGKSVNNAINYIIGSGNGNNKTIPHVPDFNEITYLNVYNNIDVKYYARQSSSAELETDFILKPGSDANNIKMRFDGIKNLSVNKKGILAVTNLWGTLREYIPSSYQIIEGKKKEVTVKYKVIDQNRYGFEVCGVYDHSKDLVIDPVVLDWATFAGPKNILPGQPGFLGEEKQAVLNDIECDPAGNTYATGWCQSGFPTTAGAYMTGNQGQADVLIFKLNPKATALVYGTFVGTTDGGSAAQTTGDTGWGIAIDAAGNAYVTGSTDRNTFPTTAGAYQTTFTGTTLAAFALKLNPAGSALVYSTFLGANSSCEGMSIEAMSTGEAIIGGYTGSGFPATAGAYKTTFGGVRDGFVAKLNAAGSTMMYGTYVGGSASDTVYRISLDAAGNTYAAGTTGSNNFPTVGAYQGTLKGVNDAFLFKLNTTGSTLVYSTYFGGTNGEVGYGVVVNSAGEAYICGGTASTDMPTLNPYQAAPKGKGDAFIAKFNTTGSALIYSTYLGGTQDDIAWDVEVDCNDNAYVTGHSRLTSPGASNCCSFPLTACSYHDVVGAGVSASPPGCNNFITKFGPKGALIYSGTKFTGAAYELRCAIDLVEVNCCVQGVVTGGTTGHEVSGYDFLTTPGVFEETDPRWTKFSTPWLYRITPQPNVTVNINPGSCLAEKILTATADTCWGTPTISWKFGDGKTGTGVPITHTYTAVGTYTVTMIASCPYDSVVKTVTITDVTPCGPTVTPTNTTICQGSCGALTATSTGGTAPYTYSWNPGAGTGSSYSVCPVTTTNYTVTVTDNAGKTGSATAMVTVNPKPTITLSGGSVCPGACATITAGGGVSYTWSAPLSGTSTSQSACPAATTTYTVTGTDANGCTNTATATVTVNPLPTITVSNLTICKDTVGSITASGGVSYTWSCSGSTGATISPSTAVIGVSTCTVTGTDANGCKNTATSTITVNDCSKPHVTSPDGTICAGNCYNITAVGTGGVGALTYAWTPNIGSGAGPFSVCPTSTTSYTVTVTDANSNTDSHVVTVTVNPLPTITATTGTICNGACTNITASGAGTGTYTWATLGNGSTQNVCPTSTSTYTVTGTDANGCSNTATTSVTVNPLPVISVPPASICPGGSTTLTATGANTYTWSPSTGLNATTGASVTANPATTTTYTVCGVDANGCSSCTTVTVTVGAIVANAGPDVTICSNASTNLNATGGTIYTWTPATGLSNPNISNPVATPTVTTTYTVTVSDGTCSDDDVVVVTVNPNPQPTITGNMTICSGSSTTLTANAGGTYSWSPGGQTTPSITVSPTNPSNTYIVTVTTNGCTGSASAVVTVNPIPAPSIPGPVTICTGQSATLTSTTAGPFIWSTGANTSAITVTPTTTTTYSVSVTVNGCTGTASQIVIVIPPVVATAPNATICAGQSTTLTAGGNGNTYLWDNGSTSKSITVNPTTTTTYTVISAIGSCADTATSTVTVKPVPTATISKDTTVKYGDSAPLKAGGGGTYNWYPPAGLSCTNCANPMATPTAPTQYCVTVTVNGCADSACVTVLIDTKCGNDDGELFVPNGFSPNGDGQNDVLYVMGGGITGMFWAIYDRWGEKIFETTNPKQGWDGTYKGKALDPAVFVYYLKVTCYSGNDIIQKGNVAIIK